MSETLIVNLMLRILFSDGDGKTVLVTVDTKTAMIFPEDVGTINVTVSLSGPRLETTTVMLSISSFQATGSFRLAKVPDFIRTVLVFCGLSCCSCYKTLEMWPLQIVLALWYKSTPHFKSSQPPLKRVHPSVVAASNWGTVNSP